MIEPKRNKEIDSLQPYVADRVRIMIKAMERRGFDPVVFEALRTYDRQAWLYGVGRTHQKNRRPVTWTMQSKHLVGKAVDIISRSRLWEWPEFYRALREEAAKVGMKALNIEQCHIQWGD